MARPLKPGNEDNPLRQLRGLIASPERMRISQVELAKICGISPNTVKKMEFGFASRQRLSPDVSEKVVKAAGALWDPKHGWTQQNGKDPFTYEAFCEHRKRVLNPSPIDRVIAQSRIDLIKCRIDWLFENVPTKSWEILLALLNQSLEKCKRDLTSNANDELFYRPAWFQSANDSTGIHPVEPEQQKRQRAPKGAAGNKKRKRKYGP
jgi:hypothetical protein